MCGCKYLKLTGYTRYINRKYPGHNMNDICSCINTYVYLRTIITIPANLYRVFKAYLSKKKYSVLPNVMFFGFLIWFGLQWLRQLFKSPVAILREIQWDANLVLLQLDQEISHMTYTNVCIHNDNYAGHLCRCVPFIVIYCEIIWKKIVFTEKCYTIVHSNFDELTVNHSQMK